MDTSLRLATNVGGASSIEPPSARTPTVLSSHVDAYLREVSDAHSRLVEALGEATSRLHGETGQLAGVAAVHDRLTRQFLDGQRSIIRRRADTDARVARIGDDARAEAESVATEAHMQASGMTMPAADVWSAYRSRAVPIVTCRVRPWPAPTGEVRTPCVRVPDESLTCPVSPVRALPTVPSIRRQIADLGVSVVRTGDEADALAQIIDEAFIPDEPNGVVAKRQLRELLDDWWRAENQEDAAAIDDAHARAVMRIHIARIEAGEALARCRPTGPMETPALPAPAGPAVHTLLPPLMLESADEITYLPPPSADPSIARQVLPPSMITALDAADHGGLDSVLASLLDSLEPAQVTGATTRPAAPMPDTPPSGALSPIPTSSAPHVVSDPFERFWGNRGGSQSEHAPKRRRVRDWVMVQVLLPAVAVVAAMALVLAVVG